MCCLLHIIKTTFDYLYRLQKMFIFNTLIIKIYFIFKEIDVLYLAYMKQLEPKPAMCVCQDAVSVWRVHTVWLVACQPRTRGGLPWCDWHVILAFTLSHLYIALDDVHYFMSYNWKRNIFRSFFKGNISLRVFFFLSLCML